MQIRFSLRIQLSRIRVLNRFCNFIAALFETNPSECYSHNVSVIPTFTCPFCGISLCECNTSTGRLRGVR